MMTTNTDTPSNIQSLVVKNRSKYREDLPSEKISRFRIRYPKNDMITTAPINMGPVIVNITLKKFPKFPIKKSKVVLRIYPKSRSCRNSVYLTTAFAMIKVVWVDDEIPDYK